MARRKRIKWEYGDLFAVPLADGSFGIVQAVDRMLPHVVYTAVTDQRAESLEAAERLNRSTRVIALLGVLDGHFDFGTFVRLGPDRLLAHQKDFPDEKFAPSRYVGAKSYTGGIVADFLSAWHGVAPWSPYKDPEYFDKLLVKGVERPGHGERFR